MSSLHMCSSQYRVNGMSSVLVVFPGANFAITLVEEGWGAALDLTSCALSSLDKMSAASSVSPAAKAAFALSNHDCSSIKSLRDMSVS